MFNSNRFRKLINILMLVVISLSSLLPTIASVSSPREISQEYLVAGQHAYEIGYYQQALDKFNLSIEKFQRNYQAYAYRAATKLALGQIDEAKEDLLIAEKHLPDSIFVKNTKAQLLQYQYADLSEQEIIELENLLDILIADDPSDFDLRLWRGSYYFNKNEFQKTIDDLAPFSSNAEALLFTGSSFFQLGKYEEAVIALEKANQISAQNESILQQLVIAYFSLEDYEKALDYQQSLIAITGPSVSNQKDLAMMNVLLNDYPSALTNYHNAYALDPTDEEVLYQIGVLSYETGLFRDAIDFFSLALAQNATWEDALLNRATALMALEEYEQAHQDYLTAYENNPDSIEILKKLSELDVFLGKTEQSIEHYATLLEKDPNNIQYLFTHAYLVITNHIETCPSVQPEFEKIIELDPTQTIPYHYLGLCAYAQGQSDVAYQYWEESLAGLPDTSDSLYFLALSDYEALNYSQALTRINQLFEYQPEYYIAYFLKGNILLEMEAYEQAIETYAIAIEEEVNPMISYFNQGVCYFNLDELIEADQHFQAALTLAELEGNIGIIEEIEGALDTLYQHPDWEE